MLFLLRVKEFFYSLSATDKYSDFDSRKSFNRINKPEAETSLLGAHQNSSTLSLSRQPLAADGVHEVRLAWRHIKKWLHKHSADLNASLLPPCTDTDLSELQKDLHCTLPQCVTEFFRMTDGQSSFNENGCGGLFFGLKLMPIDEIAVMTESWRSIHQQLLRRNDVAPLAEPVAIHNLSSSDSVFARRTNSSSMPKTRFPRQYSIPPDAILPVYAHSMWIPIITDGTGNCVAVDLSPSDESATSWGQVILFGRDFDTKFKIADNFGDFLLIFANDLEKGNWELRSFSDTEDLVSGVDAELVYVDHATFKEKAYLDVLRERATEKWISSLSDEEKSEESTVSLLRHLKATYSYHVPTLTDDATDSFITENLQGISLTEPATTEEVDKYAGHS